MKKEIKVYRCDPDKNDMCCKAFCYRELKDKKYIRKDIICRHTFNKEYEMSWKDRIKEALGIGRKGRYCY